VDGRQALETGGLVKIITEESAVGPEDSSHYTQVASHRKMQAFLTDERRHELGS
jgi:hypothetical protein